MEDFKVRYLHVTSADEALDVLKGILVDPHGIQEIPAKMVHMNIVLEAITCEAADIVRREMRSLGGDAVAACDTSSSPAARTTLILMGTLHQVRSLTEKIRIEPLGLERISERVGDVLDSIVTESYALRTSRREVTIAERTLIMGILNITPDSFSDGGRFHSPEFAVDEGIRMAEEGADIIDIGGESSRPGSESVPKEEELARVIPVIKGLRGKINIPLSIDTMKASVAREALAEGAEIVNDISALSFDAEMGEVVAGTGAAVILMHMRGTPKTMQVGDLKYRSLWGDIITFLQAKIEQARETGIEADHIMVDPGLGFGKTASDNLQLIRHLQELRILGRPIVTGASRKSFIGHVTGGSPSERCEGTAAVVTASILNGSQVVRVHDVAAMKKVAAMADALIRA
jgi:dihydropteroate synthase